MRKTIIALATVLGGILYALIWRNILDFAFNYRVIEMYEGFVLFSAMFILFYYSGVYISAAIFRFFLKRNRDIASSVLSLLYCAIGSLTLIFLIILLIPIFFNLVPQRQYFDFLIGWIFGYIIFGMILSLHILVVRKADEFETNKSIKYFIIKIAAVLLVNLTLLVVVCISNFPGVHAPIEIRQKWAYEEFRHYSPIVHSIKESNQITAQVGQIKFIAPTKGRNLYMLGGDSGTGSELTLEIVGEKGTGIAYINSWWGSITNLCFEYQGKKIKLWSSESCN